MGNLKIGFINIYGRTGFRSNKVLELENFIDHHKLDVICLQETDIDQNTFSECNILRRFSLIINNSSTGYGTCTLAQLSNLDLMFSCLSLSCQNITLAHCLYIA